MNLLALSFESGMMVVAFGMLMVFSILVLLVAIIRVFGLLFAPIVMVKKKPKKAKGNSPAVAEEEEYVESHLTAECSAAIAMALHLYYDEDVHDMETAIVTIKKVEKRYSPWSSKIYGLTNLVR